MGILNVGVMAPLLSGGSTVLTVRHSFGIRILMGYLTIQATPILDSQGVTFGYRISIVSIETAVTSIMVDGQVNFVVFIVTKDFVSISRTKESLTESLLVSGATTSYT